MLKKEIEVFKEVLSIADDSADLISEGFDIKIAGAGYRELDKTINAINAGHEILFKYEQLHKALNDPKLYEQNERIDNVE